MKKRIGIIIIILIGFSACGAHSPQKEQAPQTGQTEIENIKGVLIESSAPIEFASPKGKSFSAVVGTELMPGTTITAGTGGSARVMLMNGAIIEIPSGKKYVVGTVAKASEKQTMMRGLTLALNEAAEVSLPKLPSTAPAPQQKKSTPRVHGMVKMGGPLITPKQKQEAQARRSVAPQKRLEAIYPSGTAIKPSKTITFKWNMKVRFPKPLVVIVNPNGSSETRFDIAPTSLTSATIPAQNLKRGNKYTWYLASGKDKPGRARSRRFHFSVLTKEQEKHLAKDMRQIDGAASSHDGRAFLKGQLYFNYGMNYEMVQTLMPLWKKNKSSSLKKLLLLGYARMGRAEVAWRYK